MNIIYTADNHVGKILNYSRSLQQYGYKKFKELCQYSVENKVDALCVLGDLFDTTNPPTDARDVIAKMLRWVTSNGVKVILISGNHDEISKYYKASPVNLLSNINNVYYKNQTEPFAIEIGNVNLVCVNFSVPLENFREILCNQSSNYCKKGFRNVLLSHVPIKEEIPMMPENNISYTELPCANFDDIILGDIHKFIAKKFNDCNVYFTGATSHTTLPDWVDKDLTFLHEIDGNIEVKGLEKPKILEINDPSQIDEIDGETIVIDKINESVKILKKNPLYYSDARIETISKEIFDDLDHVTVGNIEDIHSVIDVNLRGTYSTEALNFLKYIIDTDTTILKNTSEVSNKLREIWNESNNKEEDLNL